MDSRHQTMSKPTRFSDMVDFRTPMYLWAYIDSRFNVEYDGACQEGVNNLAKPLRLEDNWPDGVIYSNPPFDTDSIIKWAIKGYEHSRKNDKNVHLLLIPDKLNHVKIQRECCHTFDKIIFFGGRIDFPSPYAVKGGASRNGSILIVQSMNIDRNNEYILLSEIKQSMITTDPPYEIIKPKPSNESLVWV